jgi:hypothetical protein
MLLNSKIDAYDAFALLLQSNDCGHVVVLKLHVFEQKSNI